MSQARHRRSCVWASLTFMSAHSSPGAAGVSEKDHLDARFRSHCSRQGLLRAGASSLQRATAQTWESGPWTQPSRGMFARKNNLEASSWALFHFSSSSRRSVVSGRKRKEKLLGLECKTTGLYTFKGNASQAGVFPRRVLL